MKKRLCALVLTALLLSACASACADLVWDAQCDALTNRETAVYAAPSDVLPSDVLAANVCCRVAQRGGERVKIRYMAGGVVRAGWADASSLTEKAPQMLDAPLPEAPQSALSGVYVLGVGEAPEAAATPQAAQTAPDASLSDAPTGDAPQDSPSSPSEAVYQALVTAVPGVNLRAEPYQAAKRVVMLHLRGTAVTGGEPFENALGEMWRYVAYTDDGMTVGGYVRCDLLVQK